jgi:hypothetical protein
LANKPEKNRWSAKDDNEISTRAFYQTGGWVKILIKTKVFFGIIRTHFIVNE